MPAEPRAPVLTLYGRSYCHLCDDMVAGLHELQERHHFELRIIDVDADPQLEQRYGELVPVLAHRERELCHYHLDVQAVIDYLRFIRQFCH